MSDRQSSGVPAQRLGDSRPKKCPLRIEKLETVASSSKQGNKAGSRGQNTSLWNNFENTTVRLRGVIWLEASEVFCMADRGRKLRLRLRGSTSLHNGL